MTAAALGLAFAGYTATRANGTEEMPRHARPLPVSADAGYRQNHQVGHNGAVFEVDGCGREPRWLDGPAPTTTKDPVTGKDLVAGNGRRRSRAGGARAREPRRPERLGGFRPRRRRRGLAEGRRRVGWRALRRQLRVQLRRRHRLLRGRRWCRRQQLRRARPGSNDPAGDKPPPGCACELERQHRHEKPGTTGSEGR